MFGYYQFYIKKEQSSGVDEDSWISEVDFELIGKAIKMTNSFKKFESRPGENKARMMPQNESKRKINILITK